MPDPSDSGPLSPVTLDASGWEDRDSAHRRIAAALDFPDWYGTGNLDALFDCLSHQRGRQIRLTGLAPGPYADRLLEVFRDAASEGWITLRLD